ncbi:hybrid sensor histidine kinase/response regulator transcription factor [Flammeovirga sp. SJP92]|uniref:hybrid sensor histidine kinase/response regulator transcription factor n=1 Tax=Flammeovirga sp. SJP92 TaxID=1775430 RepID=UPI000789049E|nr:hybrid sensor histidine kinase/response regulator transcription factor [Flammeovirga sp. SJP92]KXX67299.1 hypothetical protein AVL50_28360 [Flammeovirga sp. SJP92]
MKYYLILFIFLHPFFSSAQSLGSFESITSNDGLSQNDVLCILQDQYGFLWFGTNDGLNKYDGYSFHRYGIHPNGKLRLSSNLIYKIEEDRKGNLWIGTTGKGLNYFNQKTNEIVIITTEGNEHQGKLSNDYIKELWMDEDTLWVGTRRGLDKVIFDAETGKAIIENILTYNHDKNLEVNSIIKDKKGNIFAGTTQGLFLIKQKEKGQYDIEKIVSSISIYDIIMKKEKLILATLSGLHSYSNNQLVRLTNQSCTVLLNDKKETFWMGAIYGLQLLNLSENNVNILKSFTHQIANDKSLTTNSIRSIYKDYTGLLWVGTQGGGLNKYNRRSEQFRHIYKSSINNNISNNTVKSFAVSQSQKLWIGTQRGVNVINLSDFKEGRNNYQKIREIDLAVCIKELRVGSTAKMFIGTSNGSGPYWVESSSKNDKVDKFKEYKGAVFCVEQDEKDVIWLGTYFDGLLRFNPKTKQLTQFNTSTLSNFPSNTVRSLLIDTSENIWVGTDKGLVKISSEEKYLENPSFKVFKHEKENELSISHDYIISLLEDNQNRIWAGTLGGGLNRLEDEKKEEFKRLTTENGLPNNTIKGILEDLKGNLWVSTNTGLCKINVADSLYTTYDVSDGLQANEFQEQACLKLDNEMMFFGGINGFNSFYPEKVLSNQNPPKVQITAFYLWNKAITAGDEVEGRVLLKNSINTPQDIILNYNENSVSFEFSALHFLSPDNNKYQYRLLGYQGTWQNATASRRFVSYTNLPAGNYIFEVRGANNDGVWSINSTKFRFMIKPIFWKSNWAYFFYIFLIFVMIVGFSDIMKKRRENKHRLLVTQLEKEKEEAIYKMKLQFFTNISHEFRTPLTLINGPLDYLNENDMDLSHQERLNQYTLMKKNSSLLLKLINQVLDFRKMETDNYELEFERNDIISFIQDLIQPFYPLAQKRQINFEIETPLSPITILFSPDAMEKIIYNLLSNAFKFNKAGGEVLLLIKIVEDSFHFIVQDTGDGIPLENKSKLFDRFFNFKDKIADSNHSSGIGLSLTKSLVELHHGSIELDNTYTSGARFIVKIPMSDVYYKTDKIKVNKLPKTNNKEGAEQRLDLKENNTTSPIESKNKPLVLLVEDNEDMRFFLREGIIHHYKVKEASNGKEALELLNKHTPHLIISDIMMPVLDGLEFAKTVRSNREYDHIPFIFLSAKTSDESQVQGLKMGADDYICKPFNINVLLHKVNNIIAYRSSLVQEFQTPDLIIPKAIEMISKDKKFLEEVITILEDNLMDANFNVDALVSKMGMSRTGLYHKFKDLTGLSAGDYIRRYRLTCAHQYLEKTDWSIKEIMYQTGFNTTSYFAKCFKKQYGILPSELREKLDHDTV